MMHFELNIPERTVEILIALYVVSTVYFIVSDFIFMNRKPPE